MLTEKRKTEIMQLVDQYNRSGSNGKFPESPFIAQTFGRLGQVIREIERLSGEKISPEELIEFLIVIDRELPQDYLMG